MKTLTVLITAIFFLSLKSDKPAYQYFTAKGKAVKYAKIVKACEEADIIFFGELHNNPIAHWMELSLTKDIFDQREGNIVLGAEMFESDNQLIMNEYLEGLIRQKDFEKEMRLWPNYETDYKPLVEFAKEHQLPFVATNIPRRYASLVNREGLEGLEKLSPEAKQYLPPLPVIFVDSLKIYKEMADMMKGSGMSHVTNNIVKAQAIKDASMAYFILNNLPGSGGAFIHFNGSYHSKDHQGIIWYIKEKHPGLKIVTISCVEQEDISNLEEENKGEADYILVIPGDMTKTY